MKFHETWSNLPRERVLIRDCWGLLGIVWDRFIRCVAPAKVIDFLAAALRPPDAPAGPHVPHASIRKEIEERIVRRALHGLARPAAVVRCCCPHTNVTVAGPHKMSLANSLQWLSQLFALFSKIPRSKLRNQFIV